MFDLPIVPNLHFIKIRLKSLIMRSPIILSLTAVWAFFFSMAPAIAQWDDLYYDPDRRTTTTTTVSPTQNQGQDLSFGDEYRNYDDEAYDYMSEYDFYYSSRIRRFHRPNRSFDFYDPFFVDMVYFGYYTPGMTIYMGPSYYRPWRPRPHHFGPHFYDPFFNPYAFHRPYRPFRPYGSYYSFGFGYGFSSWGWGGYGFASCPVFYSSNTYYVNNYYNNQGLRPGPNDAIRNTHYGPRSSSGGTTARRGRTVEGGADAEMRVPDTRSTESTRTARGTEMDGGRTAAERSTNQADQRTAQTGAEPQTERQREQIAARGAQTRTTAAPSRRVQEDFSNNRVSRDEAHRDTRTNVPGTRSMDTRRSDNRIFNAPGQQRNRQTAPDTRRQQGRDLDRGDRNRSNPTPNLNRGNNQRNNPTPNINRGSNQQRSSGSMSPNRSSNQRSSGVTPSRSSNNNRSSGVSPSRGSNSSSSSGNTRSGRSGRGN
jgi:hypothetical protein